jgi:ATP-dependent exoDNAse (exonuclease V) beta subunit
MAADDLPGAIKQAEKLASQTGRIKLMTGHRSKGLEFKSVFILDRQLMNLKSEDSQDRNLLYVCQTRAKLNLFYVTSDTWESEEEEEAA